MRNALAYATHKFFQENGFTWISSPIITASDCEGAGEQFCVTTLVRISFSCYFKELEKFHMLSRFSFFLDSVQSSPKVRPSMSRTHVCKWREREKRTWRRRNYISRYISIYIEIGRERRMWRRRKYTSMYKFIFFLLKEGGAFSNADTSGAWLSSTCAVRC